MRILKIPSVAQVLLTQAFKHYLIRPNWVSGLGCEGGCHRFWSLLLYFHFISTTNSLISSRLTPYLRIFRSIKGSDSKRPRGGQDDFLNFLWETENGICGLHCFCQIGGIKMISWFNLTVFWTSLQSCGRFPTLQFDFVLYFGIVRSKYHKLFAWDSSLHMLIVWPRSDAEIVFSFFFLFFWEEAN